MVEGGAQVGPGRLSASFGLWAKVRQTAMGVGPPQR